MKMYRKKPVVIEAVQFTEDNKQQVVDWITENSTVHVQWNYKKTAILIETLEGDMSARFGDWIIKGVNGEFYPCKPDIFEKTYEQVG